jgi:hypothetical protein
MWTVLTNLQRWVDGVDPGTHRRIKGLRLVTAYGIAAALGTLKNISAAVPSNFALGTVAGSFALWASVSEGRSTRYTSSRDLTVLCIACAADQSCYQQNSGCCCGSSRDGYGLGSDIFH